MTILFFNSKWTQERVYKVPTLNKKKKLCGFEHNHFAYKPKMSKKLKLKYWGTGKIDNSVFKNPRFEIHLQRRTKDVIMKRKGLKIENSIIKLHFFDSKYKFFSIFFKKS